jgi:hypothetical protein
MKRLVEIVCPSCKEEYSFCYSIDELGEPTIPAVPDDTQAVPTPPKCQCGYQFDGSEFSSRLIKDPAPIKINVKAHNFPFGVSTDYSQIIWLDNQIARCQAMLESMGGPGDPTIDTGAYMAWADCSRDLRWLIEKRDKLLRQIGYVSLPGPPRSSGA